MVHAHDLSKVAVNGLVVVDAWFKMLCGWYVAAMYINVTLLLL